MSRTTLYVPGDRPDRFDKALGSGADAIICDLEDAVAETAKTEARDAVRDWLRANPGRPVWIRVNNRPGLLDDDSAMVRSLAADGVSFAGVVVPKADAAACAADFGDSPVMALIESAVGVAQLYEIAAAPAVVRLALGEADLAADMCMEPSADALEMWPIRTRVVVASAGAGLASPCGPVPTSIDDHEALVASSESLRRHGFGGRSVIHPKQVAAVNEAFTPSAAAIARAESIVAAFEAAAAEGRSAFILDGEFVDTAVVRQARAVLARAPRSAP